MAGVRENEGALVERRRKSIRPRLGDVAGDGAWRRPTIEVEPLSHSSCCTAKSNAVSCLFTVLISAISAAMLSALFALVICGTVVCAIGVWIMLLMPPRPR